MWALTIGVSEYEDSRINLKYADHDALRIAQMLITPAPQADIVVVADLDETERGAAGFGSTGID